MNSPNRARSVITRLVPAAVLLILAGPAIAPAGGLTFFGWSDQHVATDGGAEHLAPAIEAMNALPGREFPASAGEVVEDPAFVIGLGDITEWPTRAARDAYNNLVTTSSSR